MQNKLELNALAAIATDETVPESFSLLKPVETAESVNSNDSPFWPRSQMYQDMFENFPSGLILISLEGSVMAVNPIFCYLTGYAKENDEIFTLQNGAGGTAIDFDEIKPLLHYPSPFSYSQLEKNLGSAEVSKWVCFYIGLIRNANHQPQFFVIECRDIQAYRDEIHQLSHQIMHDPLTGLGNRKLLDYEFKRMVSAAKRQHQAFALFIIDVDHFKQINDTWGHDAGDNVLKTVAHRLRQSLRILDTVVRLGGDEFVILLHDVKESASIHTVARKIIELFKQPVMVNDTALAVTLSIGISVYPEGGDSYEMLFKNADTALYQVKQKARNHYQVYDVN